MTPCRGKLRLELDHESKILRWPCVALQQRGQLGGVVDEDTLIEMLESINQQVEAKSKVSFTRRRMDDDWD